MRHHTVKGDQQARLSGQRETDPGRFLAFQQIVKHQVSAFVGIDFYSIRFFSLVFTIDKDNDSNSPSL